MPNRFIDTERWRDPWYRKLTSTQRDFWCYLECHCNHAGIWLPTWDEVKFFAGLDPVAPDVYVPKIRILAGGEWFLPEFVLKQQMVPSLFALNPRNACHASIIKILENKSILSPLEAPGKGLTRGYSNSNGNGKHTTTSTTRHIDNIESPGPTREEALSEATKENYDTPAWADTLAQEVASFRSIGFKEDKIKALFMTRRIPERVVDKALGRDF